MKNIITVMALAISALLTTGVYAAGDAAAGKTKSASCQACHGLDGKSTNPKIPSLAGKKYEDLVTALNEYKSGKRKDPMMTMSAKPLTDADIANLAAYYSSLK